MNRSKFFISGAIIVAAITFLIISSTRATAQYFLTVDEVLADREKYTSKDVRLSGAVVGESIHYDPQTLTLAFEIAHVSGDNAEIDKEGGLAAALAAAVADAQRKRLEVVYDGPKPDMLRDEAQAILTGQLSTDGTFHAQEILLKCPSKYENALPDQSS